MPMIPLGLKETKEIDFKEPFKDFILEHYSEDGNLYEDIICELMDLRQVSGTSEKQFAYYFVGERSKHNFIYFSGNENTFERSKWNFIIVSIL